MIKLRGMAWHHARGYAPMIKASEQFQTLHPNVSLEWATRSLSDFESYPVEKLARDYDLILIDHPFVGTGVKLQVLEPIDAWLSAEYLQDQRTNSVGKSFESYTWAGRQWAVAVDAAAQVAVCREDLLQRAGFDYPTTWRGVLELANSLPNQVAIPLSPVHAYSSFVTLCAHIGNADCWRETGVDTAVGQKAIELLRDLLPVLHPRSLESDPIQMSALMSQTDEVVYVPLMFGYCNYAQERFVSNILKFINIPTFGSSPSGSLLGGVGIAVSSFSQYKPESMQFVEFVTSQPFQCGDYFAAGGQPGYRRAWLDDAINAQSHGFFKDTLATLDLAYVRPRFTGYNQFQDEAAVVIHTCLARGGDISAAVDTLNHLYCTLVDQDVSHLA